MGIGTAGWTEGTASAKGWVWEVAYRTGGRGSHGLREQGQGEGGERAEAG